MRVITGDMWSEIGKADILMVSTNARLNARNELVMGRGAALEMKNRYLSIPHLFGKKLWDSQLNYIPGVARTAYGILNSGLSDNGTKLGAFQVKWSWDMAADLSLIQFSVNKVIAIAKRYERIVVNYPGIGNGRLTEAEVAPVLSSLPDNVLVYKKG